MNPYLHLLTERPSVKPKVVQGSRESSADDAVLFARFFDGDDAAFIELFDRHTPRLGRYCRKMIGDGDRVEDLLQDIWERLVRMRNDRRERPDNPLGLLYWMARNLCLNHVRDSKHHISIESIPEWRHPGAGFDEMSHLEELVVIALGRLPLDQREVLILNAYSGYSFEEIARMMNESYGAIRTRAWRARRQLKRIIAALVELDENNGDSNREDHE
jgi:RNA polymerase sigma-70 factor (ECF subfamily)